METLSFDVGPQILKVSTVEKIKPRNWEEAYDQIFAMIDNYLVLFSIDTPGSELQKFNEQPTLVPLELSEQFLNLIRLNWDFVQRSHGTFNPFSGTEAMVGLGDLIETRDLVAIKKQEFQLRPVLLPYLIFEDTDRLMQGLGFTDYIISFPHTHLARGKRMWKIEFSHPSSGEDFHMDIINTTITIDTRKKRGDEDIPEQNRLLSPFSNRNQVSDLMGVVVTGDSAIQNYISAQILLNHGYGIDVKSTAHELVKQLWLLKNNGDIEEVFENPLL